MKDLMIDLETLGTNTNTVVLSIGACFFDVDRHLIGPKFYTTLSIQDQLAKKREINSNTLKWWMKQSAGARNVFNEQETDTTIALCSFIEFIEQNASTNLSPWGNGSVFDISILESLLNDYGLPVPWKFTNVMDLRTFRRFVAGNQKIGSGNVAHNALDDSIAQASFVIEFTGGNKE